MFVQRLSRTAYLAWHVGVVCAIIMLQFVPLFCGWEMAPSALPYGWKVYFFFVHVVAGVAWTMGAIGRLHDLDRPGIQVGLILIPVFNVAWALYLLFWPGRTGPNRFGPDTQETKASRTVCLLAAALVVATFVAGLLASQHAPKSAGRLRHTWSAVAIDGRSEAA